MDEGYFAAQRLMLEDEEMPPSAIRITWEEGGHGFVYIYDTGTKLMTVWKPYDDPDVDSNDYFHVQAKTPREVLNPLINEYSSLNYLGTPEGITQFDDNLFAEYGRQPPDESKEPDCRQFRADYDVWVAVRKLKELYLECGWVVDDVEQPSFRRDEFLEKRANYWTDVVKSLQDEASRVS
ncbi:hypothetical protein LTR08_009011 [Meristemomyces frigidus]|nr:hypothetical protein LTR08_009011 [Meristemomyces frigidus]